MLTLLCCRDHRNTGQDLLQASQHSLTTLLSTIAPPISEHEIIEIWLTHDMTGYEGVDGLVYRGLSKVRFHPFRSTLRVRRPLLTVRSRSGLCARASDPRAGRGW